MPGGPPASRCGQLPLAPPVCPARLPVRPPHRTVEARDGKPGCRDVVHRYFFVASPGEDELLLRTADFEILHQEDAMSRLADVAGRWLAARGRYRSPTAACW